MVLFYIYCWSESELESDYGMESEYGMESGLEWEFIGRYKFARRRTINLYKNRRETASSWASDIDHILIPTVKRRVRRNGDCRLRLTIGNNINGWLIYANFSSINTKESLKIRMLLRAQIIGFMVGNGKM